MARLFKIFLLILFLISTSSSSTLAIEHGTHCNKNNKTTNDNFECDEINNTWYLCTNNQWVLMRNCSPGKCMIKSGSLLGFCDYSNIDILPNNTQSLDNCKFGQTNLFKCNDGILYKCDSPDDNEYKQYKECSSGKCDPVGYYCEENNKDIYCTQSQTKCSSDLKGYHNCQTGKWSTEIISCPNGCLNGICKDSSTNFPTNPPSNEIDLSAPNEIDLSAPSDFKSLQNLTPKNSIPAIINIIYIISSLTFFFILLSGGLKWLTSGGDEKKVASARSQITHGFIGLAIVFSVWALTNLISQLFGFDINKITVFKSFYQPTPAPPPK